MCIIDGNLFLNNFIDISHFFLYENKSLKTSEMPLVVRSDKIAINEKLYDDYQNVYNQENHKRSIYEFNKHNFIKTRSIHTFTNY